MDEFSNIAESYGLNATDVQAGGFEDYNDMSRKATINAGNFSIKRFESNEELDEYIAHPDFGRTADRQAVCYGFKINEDENGQKYELELMFNDMWVRDLRAVPMQRKPAYDPADYLPEIDDYMKYSLQGFAYMQNWVANAILRHKTGNPGAQIAAFTIPQRMGDTVKDDFVFLIKGVLTFFILVMFIPPLYRTVYRIVAEKESRVKESMKMMGLRDSSYWMSWFTYYTIVNTIMSLLAWYIL